MKKLSKVLVLVLSAIMVLAMSASVFAAGGTITVENPATGETYTAYKIFDASVGTKPATGEAPVSYTITKADNPVWTAIIGDTAAVEGVYTVQGLTFTPSASDANVYIVKALDTFDAAAFAAFLDGKKASLPVAGTGTTITVTEDGYYFVDTTLGSLCALYTNNTEQKIYEKNSIPTLKKEVQEDSTSTWSATAQGDMGQTMNFRLTVNTGTNANAPGSPASNGVDADYVITDTLPAGMTYMDNAAIEGWTKDTDFTVDYTGDVLTITLKAAKVATLGQNADVVITYGARIDSDAVVGGSGNVNKATMTYQHQTTEEVQTTVYTYKFEIEKVDKADNTIKLDGVEFVLKDANGKQYKASTDNSSIWVDDNKVVTANGGKAEFVGLDAGTYTLTEVKTNDGYNLLDGDVTVTISDTGAVSMEGAKSVVDGKIVIENAQGTVLPGTGGIGTTIFYVLGSLLVVGCGIVLISRKRMQNK
ncbi:MAG: isopeptide-forming domain-containing fimbrial protein [Mogibacterium sp.]|nr:isopeptide-forming domain-containing fimbrial protein [Mogibacterium sp.]MBR2541213.1 isopeptide-forming domain-containing fimbrial protein [Mogibacterium sp.]